MEPLPEAFSLKETLDRVNCHTCSSPGHHGGFIADIRGSKTLSLHALTQGKACVFTALRTGAVAGCLACPGCVRAQSDNVTVNGIKKASGDAPAFSKLLSTGGLSTQQKTSAAAAAAAYVVVVLVRVEVALDFCLGLDL